MGIGIIRGGWCGSGCTESETKRYVAKLIEFRGICLQQKRVSVFETLPEFNCAFNHGRITYADSSVLRQLVHLSGMRSGIPGVVCGNLIEKHNAQNLTLRTILAEIHRKRLL